MALLCLGRLDVCGLGPQLSLACVGNLVGVALLLRLVWTACLWKSGAGNIRNSHLLLGSCAWVPRLTWCTDRLRYPVHTRPLSLPVRLCFRASFLSLWGVGEAFTPGPEFRIGVANLNGLNNKAFGFADYSVDTWILSETHLTKGGIVTFQPNLRQAKTPYKSFIHGCPVAQRSLASDIGQWSGVGVLTSFPARRLPHSWPPVAYNSGRLLCSGFCAKGVWISGVTVYGTPTGPTHVNGREVTDELLSLALNRVLQLSGPRFIAGDFNHDLDRLNTITTLERLGFRDIQDIHAERTGQLPVATCRGKTGRDYLFLSREMARLFVSCQVDDESLSDHSYLIGNFEGSLDLLDRFVWPVPDPMDWEAASDRQPVTDNLFLPDCHLDQDYETFWRKVEAHNNDARRQKCKPLVRAMQGRGIQRKPQLCHGMLAPTKTSRPGERQPAFLGSCLQHAQWLKQLRRLQSFLRLVRAPVLTAAHRAHLFGLWTSIRRAPGFPPSFPQWWTQRAAALGDPTCVPVEPPDAALAELLYSGFLLDFEQLEATLISARSHANRLAKASDVHAMYRTVQRDAPVQVDSLVGVLAAKVLEVDTDECALITDFARSTWNLPLCTPRVLFPSSTLNKTKFGLILAPVSIQVTKCPRPPSLLICVTSSKRLSPFGRVCGTNMLLCRTHNGMISSVLRPPSSVPWRHHNLPSRPTLSVVVCCAKRPGPPLDLMDVLICWPFRTLIWVCLSGLLILRAVLALGPSRP